MASSLKRVYWDACVWIALIQKEKILKPGGKIEDREQMCREVIESAKKRNIEILTSALCLAEVCKHPELVKTQTDDKIAAFFERDFVFVVNVDTGVGERARKLMMAGHKGLRPPDAIHVATALLLPGIEEMHTFDGKLLDLDGLLSKPTGEKLKVCKPGSAAAAPLLEKLNEGQSASEDRPPA
ncbi:MULTISPECIES: type II toxin-antitoxin system VapC family toxin [unclassified Bradyrhizobium]|uniref:type II toxin-antitoxin system VapC family toxin n=1 Tax=unclassified Bradyrhizobium TaxID=2631580 RepID=UPI0028EC1C3D|nr:MULTISPECIES: PIN domain-containing protein [unclassified Bradyrhizobium]